MNDIAFYLLLFMSVTAVGAIPVAIILVCRELREFRKALSSKWEDESFVALCAVDKLDKSKPSQTKKGKELPEWAVMGEEGPRLINFSNPDRAYIATPLTPKAQPHE